jgi:hypothetical protein
MKAYIRSETSDLRAFMDYVSSQVTEFWLVSRDGVLLAVYGGHDGERMARSSSFAANGAEVTRADNGMTYRQACKLVARGAPGSSPYNWGKLESQRSLLERSAYSKTSEFYAAVLEYVSGHPGCTVTEVVAGVGRHHYRNEDGARGALQRVLTDGVGVPGVRAEWPDDGSQCRLWERGEE